MASPTPAPRSGPRSGPRLGHVSAAVLVAAAVFLVLGGLVAALSVRAYSRSQSELNRRVDPALDSSETLIAAFTDEETGIRGLLVTGNVAFLAPYTRAQSVSAARVRQLQLLTAGHPAERAQLAVVLAAHDRWRREAADPARTTALAGDLPAARAIEAQGVGKSDFEALRVDVSRLSGLLRVDRAAAESQVSRQDTGVLVVGSVELALALIVLAALSLLLRRGVLRPLAELADAADRAATVDRATPLPIAGPPEIRGVAASVERMRAALLRQLQAAQAAREALEQRGEAVLALQGELNPHLRSVPGLVVAARLEPAEGLLAGDWYDQVRLQDGRVALVLGDVSGHGAAAGAYALSLSSALRASLAAGMAPGRALANVAGLLDDSEIEERFASVFVVVLDTEAGLGEYASAGHPDAWLFDPDGGATPLPATGPLLATLLAAPGAWATRPLSIRDGALLLAVTDGLLEARDAGREEFGADRLVAVAREEITRTGTTSPRDLLAAVFDRVAHFVPDGRGVDDCTAVAVVCRDASDDDAERAGR